MKAAFFLALLFFGPLRADCAVWEQPYPWTEAGLSDEEAAVHLLNRLAYGPRPDEVQDLVRMGLAAWIEKELAGDLPGTDVAMYSALHPELSMSQEEVLRTFANEHDILQEAIAAGRVNASAYYGRLGENQKRSAYRALERFTSERGFRSQQDLVNLLRGQKVFRAIRSESQLTEVLTDFWFNHFNVSIESSRTLYYTLSYERDAIRPNVLGNFRTLLGATARHPAMLLYLGNADSVADQHRTTSLDLTLEPLDDDLSPTTDPTMQQRLALDLGWRDPQFRMRRRGDDVGLNENYARELLELHTLGVDGGYRQHDVIETARVFTGWSVLPRVAHRGRLVRNLQRGGEDLGFVMEEDFLFRPDHHDAEEKTVLGISFPPGGGIEEGERVLDHLAQHPATRRFLVTKLVRRFVDDTPPPALVKRLAEVWELTGGDLRQVMRALIASPEFWQTAQDPDRRKMKSPLEIAVSAVRAIGGKLEDPVPLTWWIGRAGQPLYACAPPTGYSEDARVWTDVGGLRERLQFGITLADGRIRGVRVDHLALLHGGEPRSVEEALEVFRPFVLPHRPIEEDSFWQRLAERLAEEAAAQEAAEAEEAAQTEAVQTQEQSPAYRAHLRRVSRRYAAHAVGILLASPDFQVK